MTNTVVLLFNNTTITPFYMSIPLSPIFTITSLSVVVITSLRMANSTLSKLIGKVSHGNYKKTQQEVSDALLPYLYNRYIVCANNKYIYPNIHMLLGLPYYYYKINMFFNIIILDSSTSFQIYNLISCDITCDHSHIPLHCLRKLNEKKNKKQNKK